MRQYCTQCLSALDHKRHYETPRGELLCGSCYAALWGPSGLRRRNRPGIAGGAEPELLRSQQSRRARADRLPQLRRAL